MEEQPTTKPCEETRDEGSDEDCDEIDGNFLNGIRAYASFLGGRMTPTKRAPISERGEEIRDSPSDMAAHLKMALARGFYHPENNPKGALDLGTSVNNLCQDMLLDKINSPDVQNVNESSTGSVHQTGNDRAALADFFTKNFHSSGPLNPRSLVVTGSEQAGLDLLVTMLCNPGDGCLVFTPCCAADMSNIAKRTGVKLIHCPLTEVKTGDISTFTIDPSTIEKVISGVWFEGITMRVAILDNPKNPTGDVLSEPELIQIIQTLHKHNMHVIVNEVSALSTLPSHPFTSVLSLDNIPDPYMVHFLWAFPEEFAQLGLSCGVVYTWIPKFADMCFEYMSGAPVSAAVQQKLTVLLQDEEWLTQYFSQNLSYMAEAYLYFEMELRGIGISTDVNAGNYIWVNLSQFLPTLSKQEEHTLFEELLKTGVFIRPGTSMLSKEPGWFRITITNHPNITKMGLEKLIQTLRKRKETLGSQSDSNTNNLLL